jgi:hypothetical protein
MQNRIRASMGLTRARNAHTDYCFGEFLLRTFTRRTKFKRRRSPRAVRLPRVRRCQKEGPMAGKCTGATRHEPHVPLDCKSHGVVTTVAHSHVSPQSYDVMSIGPWLQTRTMPKLQTQELHCCLPNRCWKGGRSWRANRCSHPVCMSYRAYALGLPRLLTTPRRLFSTQSTSTCSNQSVNCNASILLIKRIQFFYLLLLFFETTTAASRVVSGSS